MPRKPVKPKPIALSPVGIVGLDGGQDALSTGIARRLQRGGLSVAVQLGGALQLPRHHAACCPGLGGGQDLRQRDVYDSHRDGDLERRGKTCFQPFRNRRLFS